MPNGEFLKPAMNTMIAPWWKLLLARIFGECRVGYDSGWKVTCHEWRGKMYVTDCRLDTMDD